MGRLIILYRNCAPDSGNTIFPATVINNVDPNPCQQRPVEGGTGTAFFSSGIAEANVPAGLTCELKLFTLGLNECTFVSDNALASQPAGTCSSSPSNNGAQRFSWSCAPSPPPQGYPAADVPLLSALPDCALGLFSTTVLDVPPISAGILIKRFCVRWEVRAQTLRPAQRSGLRRGTNANSSSLVTDCRPTLTLLAILKIGQTNPISAPTSDSNIRSQALALRQAPTLPKADITFTSGPNCGSAINGFPPYTIPSVPANSCVHRTPFGFFTSAFTLTTSPIPDGISCTSALHIHAALACSTIEGNVGASGPADTCLSGQSYRAAHVSYTCAKAPPPLGYPRANVTLFDRAYCPDGGAGLVTYTDSDVNANECVNLDTGKIAVLGSARADAVPVPDGYKCELVLYATSGCSVQVGKGGEVGVCAPFDARVGLVKGYKWVCGPL
ncbi:hypothetical protein CC86DRAFT_407767 [Ophiobolus disseminans]|uniref:Uncharacterized protein n=1 Tax=Ophiobolus disseminans TaxID=1469910 RepID=A0A6A6ZW46_9PLEO|nr:hypothetical protein CC86DRAFT_407767 [Ophiobolus disseminans]